MPMQIDARATSQRLRALDRQAYTTEAEPASEGDLLSEIEEIDLEPLLTPPSVATSDDTELVRRIQQGDMAAFEALFHKYQSAIYRTGLAITRDPGVAEEV